MKWDPKKLIVIATTLFLSMVFIDGTGVAVTLPQMKADLLLSNVGVQWVMNGLFLPLAVLVLFAGKLSDHIGQRKAFTIGMGIFLVASVICAFAPDEIGIIVGRILQGIGASFLLSTYALLISSVFPPNERGVALGTCASFASIFLATGPFIGGAFAHYLSWRWIFAVNIPLGLLSLYFIYQCIGKDVIEHKNASFDISGLLIFIVGFTALIYALMQAVTFGWTSFITLGLLLTSIVLLPLFAFLQLKKSHPLADLRLFKNRSFFAGNMILFSNQVVAMSLTYWAIWLQTSLGFSPLMAGLGLIPAGLPVLIMARLGGKWLDQKGPKFPLVTGSLILLVGMIWLALTAHFQSYWISFWGFLAYGIGVPLIISPGIALVLGSVDSLKRGMAAGILNTMRQLGTTLCFAIVGVLILNINKLELLKYQGKLQPNMGHIYTIAFSYGMSVAAFFALISFFFSVVVLKKR